MDLGGPINHRPSLHQKHLFLTHRHITILVSASKFNKTTFGLRIAWDQSAKIAKVRELLWRFYGAIVTWCYLHARSTMHQVALQTLGGVLRECLKAPLPHSEMNWYHTKRLMKHVFQTPHDSWNEVRWHWNKMNSFYNWFMQNSICGKGQAPCYATKPTNYNYSSQKPSKTVGISQSLP